MTANNNIRTFFTLLLLTGAITLNAADLYQTTADLNLRSGPGSKYNSIGIVKNGENVSVLEKDNSLWFKVEYTGKNGFLSSKFLTLVVIEPPKVAESLKIETVPEESNSAIFIIIGAVIVIIIMGVAISSKKKSIALTNANSQQESEKELKEELKKHILNNIKITVTTSSSTYNTSDDSIIDVTGESYNINTSGNFKKYTTGVPIWAHQ